MYYNLMITFFALISLIDFKPPDDSKRKIYIVVGVVSALCLIFFVFVILWSKGFFGGKKTREEGTVNTCANQFSVLKR